MSDSLHQQLAEYDRAVGIAGSTYPEISRDERGALDQIQEAAELSQSRRPGGKLMLVL
ncbi:hypothetical protein [Streptomyces microflavus]|uniref:hypothetical protein n=1 Tax=Streptomyces microflavus TaxID=1919 RepID=UPI0033B0AE80